MSEVAGSARFWTGHELFGPAPERKMPVELSLRKFCSNRRYRRARENAAVGPIRVSSYKPPRRLSAGFSLYCFLATVSRLTGVTEFQLNAQE